MDWPADLAGAYHWRIRNGLWQRQPDVDQQQLESWVAAEPGIDIPEQTNCYVLASLGQPAELDIYTASRATLVLVGAGSVLAVGLLLLYFPGLRHPSLLFVAGVLLAAGALMFPEPALLLAQAAFVGAALAVSAVVLERYLRRRRHGPLVVRSGSSSIVEPGSTRAHQRAQPPASGSETAPLVSAGES